MTSGDASVGVAGSLEKVEELAGRFLPSMG
jgi:hypothetical protein